MNPDKTISSDHDTLIRVETKMDGLVTDIKEMKDGVQKTLADHELRIKKVEDIVQVTTPIETLGEFRKLQLEVRDFKTTANAFRVIAGLVGGGIMYLLTQIPNVLRGWGLLK